ncbi:MAG: DUF655 domain-containing protein [Candidatus Methanomethylicia archaeon]|nr:DUF655 domain-containing protein [Candidatus Methanomethylicia archaeon]MCX8169246.1 DUF655 domain-containing protein [Candidatus Methanomethylicia archaeon]MDW7988972.1 DUF655 domain-containing protein [Nitrososphaerota archaeon]
MSYTSKSKERSETTYYEDYAYVLDFLPYGHPLAEKTLLRSEPIAQVIGKNFFILLEVAVRPGIYLAPRELVYIGRGIRDKILRIRRKINYEDLTIAAKDELSNVIEVIVTENEKRFVEFFNTAGSLTTRLHTLQLLPGIGKKHLWDILEERKKKPFENFEEIKLRVRISDPKKLIVKRIISELMREDKYRLFVKG